MDPYIITLLVTVEQEQAIRSCFHEKGWPVFKTSFRTAFKEELDLFYRRSLGDGLQHSQSYGPLMSTHHQPVYGPFQNLLQSPLNVSNFSETTPRDKNDIPMPLNFSASMRGSSSETAHVLNGTLVQSSIPNVVEIEGQVMAGDYRMASMLHHSAQNQCFTETISSAPYMSTTVMSPPLSVPIQSEPCNSPKTAVSKPGEGTDNLSKINDKERCSVDEKKVTRSCQTESVSDLTMDIGNTGKDTDLDMHNLFKKLQELLQDEEFDLEKTHATDGDLSDAITSICQRLFKFIPIEQLKEKSKYILIEMSKDNTKNKLTEQSSEISELVKEKENTEEFQNEFTNHSKLDNKPEQIQEVDPIQNETRTPSEPDEINDSVTMNVNLSKNTVKKRKTLLQNSRQQKRQKSARITRNTRKGLPKEKVVKQCKRKDAKIVTDSDVKEELSSDNNEDSMEVSPTQNQKSSKPSATKHSKINPKKAMKAKGKNSKQQKVWTRESRFGINRNLRLHSYHRKCRNVPTDLDTEFYSINEKGYFCSDCRFIFPKKNKFLLHKKLKAGETCVPDCIFCDAEENKEVFRCLKCPKVFETQELLERHVEKHITDVYKCSFCDDIFYTIPDLRLHTQQLHGDEVKETFLCDLCGSEFKEKKILNAHRKYVHTNERPEGCPKCDRSFKTKSQLKNHLVTHMKPDDYDLSCEICGKMFTRVATLKDHVRRHKKEFTFFCDVCKKGFYKKHSLEEHRRVHTGDKPYDCKYCDFKCALSCNLAKHMKTHLKQQQQQQLIMQ